MSKKEAREQIEEDMDDIEHDLFVKGAKLDEVAELPEKTIAGTKDKAFPEQPIMLDTEEIPMQQTVGTRYTLPIGIWAQAQCASVVKAVKCGSENEKNFFSEPNYQILILTNRTVKIRSRNKPENHLYAPFENISSYQLMRDVNFERRLAKGDPST